MARRVVPVDTEAVPVDTEGEHDVSRPRILRDNRRHARRGPDLTAFALNLAVLLLTAVGLLKRRAKPKGKERLSAQQDHEYAEWLDTQRARVG